MGEEKFTSKVIEKKPHIFLSSVAYTKVFILHHLLLISILKLAVYFYNFSICYFLLSTLKIQSFQIVYWVLMRM